MFAARITDMHVCPLVNGIVPHVGGPIVSPSAPTVLIGGLPAAGAGSMCTCVGPPDIILPVIAMRRIMAGGMPLARMGDMTSHGGSVILGCFTVMVGAGAINPSEIAGMASSAASAAADVVSEATAVMDEISNASDEINALLEQGNLSETEQNRLNDLQEDYSESIDDMGMNEDDFTDWTA